MISVETTSSVSSTGEESSTGKSHDFVRNEIIDVTNTYITMQYFWVCQATSNQLSLNNGTALLDW